MNNLKRLVMLVMLFGLSGTALADRGVYIGGNVGVTGAADIVGDSSALAVGASANIGYQFNRFLAVETGVSLYTARSDTSSSSSSLNGLFGAHVAVKGILPFSKRFSVFGKVGASLYGAYFGAGAAYKLTPKLDLTAQVTGVTFILATIGQVTGGLTYHFSQN